MDSSIVDHAGWEIYASNFKLPTFWRSCRNAMQQRLREVCTWRTSESSCQPGMANILPQVSRPEAAPATQFCRSPLLTEDISVVKPRLCLFLSRKTNILNSHRCQSVKSETTLLHNPPKISCAHSTTCLQRRKGRKQTYRRKLGSNER